MFAPALQTMNKAKESRAAAVAAAAALAAAHPEALIVTGRETAASSQAVQATLTPKSHKLS
jgi:hypothetical protein